MNSSTRIHLIEVTSLGLYNDLQKPFEMVELLSMHQQVVDTGQLMRVTGAWAEPPVGRSNQTRPF